MGQGQLWARRAIVAVPIAIASQIIYEPMLPADRSFLHQRMPGGAIVKIAVVYDEPFWRADGLSGQTTSPDSPAAITLDACTDRGQPGVLCVIAEGPAARRSNRLDEAERKAAIIAELVDRFGHKAGSPVSYHEQDWAAERYSGGGMISHAPTRGADRVRPGPVPTRRSRSLSRHRKLRGDVRMDRRRDSFG